MATGLSVPVRTGANGGLKVDSGDANARNILQLALGDDDNDNPFQQDIGMGIGMTFDANDPVVRPRIIVRLFEVFERFEQLKRFKLMEETLSWTEEEKTGNLILEFSYINLESDEVDKFRRNFQQTGSTNPGIV